MIARINHGLSGEDKPRFILAVIEGVVCFSLEGSQSHLFEFYLY
jgi:hypothetical protein